MRLDNKSCGVDVLEFLVLVNDLDTMLVLLLGSFFAHIGEMTVDRHDRGSCRVSCVGRWTIFFSTPWCSLWGCRSGHDETAEDDFVTGAKAMVRDSNLKWSDVAACDHTVDKSINVHHYSMRGDFVDFLRVFTSSRFADSAPRPPEVRHIESTCTTYSLLWPFA